MADCCKDCRFFHSIPNPDIQAPQGQCRVAHPGGAIVGLGAGGQVQVTQIFPPVKLSDWCGEFDRRPEGEPQRGGLAPMSHALPKGGAQ